MIRSTTWASRCGIWGALVATLVAVGALSTGCATEPPTIGAADAGREPASLTASADRAHRSRARAAAMIWNPAPDPRIRAEAPRLAPRPRPAPTAPSRGDAVDPSATSRTLVLYDAGGAYGWLGELYATGAANLASHFGSWVAHPSTAYACGELAAYDATIYLGSTYDEPLPTCLLDDVLATTRPVVWIDFNFWQLVQRAGGAAFTARFGFRAELLDFSRFASVRYRGRTLTRYVENRGLLSIEIVDPSRAIELATAVREDGTTSPWAVRSGNLFVVSEIPFAFLSEEDRVLAFDDLLFDALAPSTPERHRALVRIEDVDPTTSPASLRAITDYLSGAGVPFGIGVIAEYRDPTGHYSGGVPEAFSLRDSPDLVDALGDAVARGATLVMHGRTHQWDGGPNPYDGVTGDDTEFFRVVENPDHTFSFVGPLPEDSLSWASGRIRTAERLFHDVHLPTPTIFEFPHYTASASAYAAAQERIGRRWERSLYFGGRLSGRPIEHGHWLGQLFPYVVRDVYGSRVVPENLGNVELAASFGAPPRLPADIVRAADRNLVVRDGVAAFYFHPFLPIEHLREAVEGIRALGYTFVAPETL